MRFPRIIGVIGVAATLPMLVSPPAQVAETPAARYAALVVGPAIGNPLAVRGTPAQIQRRTVSGFASAPLMPQASEPALPVPLWYDQNPRLVRADHAGGLSLDNFLVAGDVATLTFERLALSAVDSNYIVRESWRRTRTTDIGGHLVSVFDPSWNDFALWDGIGWQRRGFDRPNALFGTLLIPRSSGAADAGEDAVERFPIWIRLTPLNVPAAQITQIDASTQYASHVVNLVMPGFGNRRLSDGDYGHEVDEAAKRVYAHLRDEYAAIAFVPRQQHVVRYEAFHLNVRNPIAGLGALPVFDNSAAYGSAGVLRSVEFYPNVAFTSNATSTHAISHQWVDYWDWSGLAGGIDRAGREPFSHTPLLHPGEVYAGAVLDVTRRVAAAAGGASYAVERTPAPAMLHPTTLYRMGLIGPEAVPELLVFENQRQFHEHDSSAPSVGTAIAGSGRRVHINDVLARHGTRSGPVDDTWSRVTVVVSRNGLLSAEEMSYWNFYAARHAATGGTTTLEGVPSFYEATGRAVPLRTDVTPLHAAKLLETFDTGYMPIAPGEFKDVQLDAPLPARFSVGETIALAGEVTTAERDDFNLACVNWTYPGAPRVVRVGDGWACDAVTGDRFSIAYRFTIGDVGQRALELYLDYPDAPRPLLPRVTVSGITIAAQLAPQSTPLPGP